MKKNLSLKRVYDPPEDSDGLRVLVDRVWPRGLTKEKAKIDVWLKDIAPGTELRKWFAHDVAKWKVFHEKYTTELLHNKPAVEELRKLLSKQNITLVFGAKDVLHNQAVVIKEFMSK
ncbi:MAG: DUF488 family protein [Hydrotalea flava]|uniref:DUF488 domain-containing protein n=1 Tax=Hydrotalea lipotrueae TaxID=2803817 RepID=UPI0016900247|nr:DUF488 domain-containing protein [Hydrotalea lipotrueae]NIM34753.1 DUF488 family protein [Hydrotalea flava]GHT27557.1 hypothetical protein FACS189432_04300 [Bacteroidia bacterium]NIM37589.1 DUF488 family protein [Hydrotalea flava]NIN02749.1 DUF488 family protein [Hydrotalea flava]NIN14434.1 DUF488 family protein [Hydrotalea flava]